MRKEDVPLIRDLPLLAGMSDENVRELLRGEYLQHFPPSIELIREGDAADFLHVLVGGPVTAHSSRR